MHATARPTARRIIILLLNNIITPRNLDLRARQVVAVKLKQQWKEHCPPTATSEARPAATTTTILLHTTGIVVEAAEAVGAAEEAADTTPTTIIIVIGIVIIPTVVVVAEEEAVEDMAVAAGAIGDHASPPIDSPPRRKVWIRSTP